MKLLVVTAVLLMSQLCYGASTAELGESVYRLKLSPFGSCTINPSFVLPCLFQDAFNCTWYCTVYEHFSYISFLLFAFLVRRELIRESETSSRSDSSNERREAFGREKSDDLKRLKSLLIGEEDDSTGMFLFPLNSFV